MRCIVYNAIQRYTTYTVYSYTTLYTIQPIHLPSVFGFDSTTLQDLSTALRAEMLRVCNATGSDISSMITDSLEYAASKADRASQPVAQRDATSEAFWRVSMQFEWLSWFEKQKDAQTAPGTHMVSEWSG